MVVDGLSDSLGFSPTIGADARVANTYERGGQTGMLGEVDFYTRYVVVHTTWPHLIKQALSHGGLMLDCEIALTRQMDVPPLAHL